MRCSQYSQSSSSLTEVLVACTYPGCKQLFRSRFSCKRHQLVHTREKRFACVDCGRKFSFAQHLREHSYRHKGLKPYVCGVGDCAESFRHSSELSLHRRSHSQYRLKKYHYVKETAGSKRLSRKSTAKPKRSSYAQTSKHSPETLTSRERVEGSLETQGQSPSLDLLGLDIKFLYYIQNIAAQNDGTERPKLPQPSGEWTMEGKAYNSSKCESLFICTRIISQS
eukprot:TRINITY_DN7517_c0_g1_i4.p1 TRINITY_DN7517_c0_g1~~TRINITY_DN7517_c0_g1_i4.p1  ORF type:complete len:224 (-),score=6.56 TRINITY_DN7517_c0_g1_i4:220-891(-)